MIDTDRMIDGAELASELRKGKGGGIPWMVILDSEGEPQITSDGPKGNCGCPAAPHEIDHFLAMLDATRRHMTADDRVILERELRAYGAELLRPRRDAPGLRDYSEAVRRVKAGRFVQAVALLKKALGNGYSPQLILTDPSLRPLREDPERRLELADLVKKHVTENHVQIVDAFEPGRRIRLTGRVVDRVTEKPLAGALVHLFHTDAGGEYRPGMDAGGGAGNPRLFGYLRTDDEGRFTVDTIMPNRYPNSNVPRHVHYQVWASGYPEFDSECFFDSDPNLSEQMRRRAPFSIVRLESNDDGLEVGTLTVRVPSR